MPASSSRWCFTLNNPTANGVPLRPPADGTPLEWDIGLVDHLDVTACTYAVVGFEVGANGTPHLQGYFRLASRKSMSWCRNNISNKCHYEQARGSHDQAADYCKKDGNFREHGEHTDRRARGGSGESPASKKQKTKMLLDESNTFDDLIDSGILSAYHVKTIANARHIMKQQRIQPYRADDVRGIWIYGPPGTGKSHWVHETFGHDLYMKQQNKWWDGYCGEKYVLLDDMDTNTLSHHLKLWADRYPVTAEIKGGSVHLSHRRFIVTSNFSIEELFAGDHPKMCSPVTVAAIERRFFVINKTELDQDMPGLDDKGRPLLEPEPMQEDSQSLSQDIAAAFEEDGEEEKL